MTAALTDLTNKEGWTVSELEAVEEVKDTLAELNTLGWDSSGIKIKMCFCTTDQF